MKINNYAESVSYALQMRGMAGSSLEQAGLRVFRRENFLTSAIFAAVGKGGIVMPVVQENLLGGQGEEMSFCCIKIVNRAKEEITIFNPISGREEIRPLESFLAEWEKAGSDCVTAFEVDGKTYLPQLEADAHCLISQELSDLCEQLAEKNHDAWALERQSEGWTYGPKRDDSTLQTPDMVPYAELPETEKEYDRIMGRNTIRQILGLGYRIEK